MSILLMGAGKSVDAAAPPAGWQFSDLATLARVDLDGNALTGADGSAVSTFTDQRGNYNATLNSGTAPKLRKNVLNNRHVVEFTASDLAQMQLSSALLGSATSGSYMLLAKLKNDPPLSGSGNGDAGAFFSGFTPDTSANKATHWPYQDGNVYEHFGITNGGRLSFNPTPSLSSTYRAIYVEMSATGTMTVFIDDTQVAQQASYPTPVGFGAIARQLGYTDGGSSQFYLNGYFARGLVFDYCLSTTERQKGAARLLWDAGLQAQLPAGHPYLSVAP